MKLYCLVENNTLVVGPVPLLSEKLINLTDDELSILGWRIAECVNLELAQYSCDINFDIQPTKVICTYVLQDNILTQNI
jgi:hypothetical protein